MKLHEQTQRFILLLIFYLFGPILTLGIIGGIGVRKHSSNARSWERSLYQQTGLNWTIKSVEFRSPGFIRLHEIKIFDDTAILHAEQIDVQLVSGTPLSKVFHGISPSCTENTGLTDMLAKAFPSLFSTDRFWKISALSVFLDFREHSSDDSALLIQNMLRRISSRLASLSDVPVQLTFEQIAIISEYSLKRHCVKASDNFDFFRFVQGSIYRTPKEIRSDWTFQIKGVSELDWEHREQLSFSFSPSDAFDISFKSGRQPIPCDLAAVFCAPFKHFSGGSFHGEFFLSTLSGSKAQTIRLNNVTFKNVPLAPLVGPYTDFAVEGTIVDFQLPKAVFGAEDTYAEGHLLVKEGAIEKTLFYHCVDKFQLTVVPESILDSPPQMIPFTDCAIHFLMQPAGIDFWADRRWQDMFMYHPGGGAIPNELRVYLPSQRRTVTYHELMSIFAADGTPVVPLTSGFRSLIQILPIR